jgi:hypothetical protein
MVCLTNIEPMGIVKMMLDACENWKEGYKDEWAPHILLDNTNLLR